MGYLGVENPLDLNSRGVGGFNCGGFALGSLDWYCPPSFTDLTYNTEPYDDDDVLPSDDECLEILAAEILEDFPYLRRVKSPCGVKKNRRVIGFRLDTNGCCERFADFHFITRIDGKWWEKQGNWYIQPFRGSIFGPWGFDSRFQYDGTIAWFVDDSN